MVRTGVGPGLRRQCSSSTRPSGYVQGDSSDKNRKISENHMPQSSGENGLKGTNYSGIRNLPTPWLFIIEAQATRSRKLLRSPYNCAMQRQDKRLSKAEATSCSSRHPAPTRISSYRKFQAYPILGPYFGQRAYSRCENKALSFP